MHACHHDHSAPPHAKRRLALALGITLGFMALEVAAALWSGSLALLADAGHMLADAGALGLALLVSWLAERPRDTRRTYGYRRAEVLGAMLNAVGLLAVAGFVVHEAIERFGAPPQVKGEWVVATGLAGLGINVLAAWLLSRGGGSHNVNVRAAIYHVLGDALGSVAALAAGLAVSVWGWRMADPVASVVIATLLVAGSARLLLETTHVLMEGVPASLDVRAIERTIRQTPGVSDVHDLHVWALTPEEPMLTAHVVLRPGSHGTEVARRVGERLRREHGIEHVTIQPEPPRPGDVLVPLRLTPRERPERPSQAWQRAEDGSS